MQFFDLFSRLLIVHFAFFVDLLLGKAFFNTPGLE
jgi:hypothetical protein